MAKAKPKKQVTMRVRCWAGTTSQHEEKRVDTPAKVKSFLRARIVKMEKWATGFSVTMAAELRNAREGLDAVNIGDLKPGAKREWSARDDHTGVRLVFGFEVEAK